MYMRGAHRAGAFSVAPSPRGERSSTMRDSILCIMYGLLYYAIPRYAITRYTTHHTPHYTMIYYTII